MLRYLNKMLSNWNPITLNRVRDVVAEFKPDVINTHCMLSFAVDGWKAGVERDIPVVHALHEFNLICRNTNAFRDRAHVRLDVRRALQDPTSRNARWMSTMLSGVVGVSHHTQQRHLYFGFFHHVPERLRRVIWSMPPIAIRPRAQAPTTGHT